MSTERLTREDLDELQELREEYSRQAAAHKNLTAIDARLRSRALELLPALMTAAAPTVETHDVHQLIEASSLGTPEAKAARDRVPRATAIAVVKAAELLGERDQARRALARIRSEVRKLRQEDPPPLGGSTGRANPATEMLDRIERAADTPGDAPSVWLCSQCGELPTVMVKIGTDDGWCTKCLDEAAGSDHEH